MKRRSNTNTKTNSKKNMRDQIRDGRKAVLRLIYPPHCPVCDRLLVPEEYDQVHALCRQKLTRVEEPTCLHCGKPVASEEMEYCYDCAGKHKDNPITAGKALYLYKGAAKQMMYRFKYGNRGSYADHFASLAADRYGDWIRRVGVEAVVPVPMYKRKERKRGYNQATCLAQALGEQLNLPVDRKRVTRVADTKALKLLTPEERKNNLKSAFHVEKSIVEYRKILLVDDIYTTGSTVETIAAQLREVGIEEVYFLTVCIGDGY